MQAGRVAVIFGGASGIGLATARKCAGLGMELALADVDQAALDAAAREFPKALCIRCDATSESEVRAFADRVYGKWNDCGFLFNNTGIMRGDSAFRSKLEDWRRVLKVTLEAAIIGSTEFVPRMLQQPNKKAVVATTSSVSGLVNSMRDTGAPYTVAKHASRVYTESLAFELRGTDISVHCLCPGPVDTNLLRNSRGANESFSFEKTGISDAVLAKGLTPEYVAQCLLDGIANKSFFIVVAAPNFPVPILAETMRLTVDDVENGGDALSHLGATGDRAKEVKARYAQALKRVKSKL